MDEKNLASMQLFSGIITDKLKDTKDFYSKNFGFGVTFENDWFILLHSPNKQASIAFLQPDHPSQQQIFRKAFNGDGVFFTIQVDDVDKEYARIKKLNIPIEIDLRDEPWGDRHFSIVDPNGIGIDIVTYTPPK